MESYHSIIVSSSQLFVDAISHILKEENISITTVIASLKESHPLAQTQTTIIIDGDDPQLNEPEIITSLSDATQKSLVISLSMTKNQMIVLQRRRIIDVTPTILTDVIKNQP